MQITALAREDRLERRVGVLDDAGRGDERHPDRRLTEGPAKALLRLAQSVLGVLARRLRALVRGDVATVTTDPTIVPSRARIGAKLKLPIHCSPVSRRRNPYSTSVPVSPRNARATAH